MGLREKNKENGGQGPPSERVRTLAGRRHMPSVTHARHKPRRPPVKIKEIWDRPARIAVSRKGKL